MSMDLGERINSSNDSAFREDLFHVEPLSEVRTLLADFLSILLGRRIPQRRASNKAKLLVRHLAIE